MGPKPGRPASPRPAGLPPSPMATSLIRGRGNTIQSDPNRAPKVGSDPRYRKASPWIDGPTLHARKHNPWESHVETTSTIQRSSRWNGGTRGHSARPFGLDQAGRPPNSHRLHEAHINHHPDKIRSVHEEVGARWQDPQAGRPRGCRPASFCRL